MASLVPRTWLVAERLHTDPSNDVQAVPTRGRLGSLNFHRAKLGVLSHARICTAVAWSRGVER